MLNRSSFSSPNLTDRRYALGPVRPRSRPLAESARAEARSHDDLVSVAPPAKLAVSASTSALDALQSGVKQADAALRAGDSVKAYVLLHSARGAAREAGLDPNEHSKEVLKRVHSAEADRNAAQAAKLYPQLSQGSEAVNSLFEQKVLAAEQLSRSAGREPSMEIQLFRALVMASALKAQIAGR